MKQKILDLVVSYILGNVLPTPAEIDAAIAQALADVASADTVSTTTGTEGVFHG